MSSVKVKNATIKAVTAAIADGTLPAGLLIAGRLTKGRIWIDINAAPIDTIRPERIQRMGSGTGYTIDLFADDLVNYTPEGVALKAKIIEIASAVCPKGLHVHFSSECFMRQGRRALAAASNAAPVAG